MVIAYWTKEILTPHTKPWVISESTGTSLSGPRNELVGGAG
jgi:hypothetical protein